MFKKRLVNKFLIISVGVLMCSCTAQTYNFMSPNDPFIDSSRSISARILTGTASKEAQLTVRTYKNLVLGASVFSNHGSGPSGAFVARFAGEGLLAYNIPLAKDKRWQLSLGGGYSQGDNYVHDATFITSYVEQDCQTNYHAYFGQIGLNAPIGTNTSLKFFLKYNDTFFDYYYFKENHGSPKNTVATYRDTWEFKNEKAGMLQIMSILKHSPSPYLSYFIEAGLSATSAKFNPEDYKVHQNTNKSYTTTESSNVNQPNYIPFFVRVGLELNIKRFSLLRK